jgi:hypothetical protein
MVETPADAAFPLVSDEAMEPEDRTWGVNADSRSAIKGMQGIFAGILWRVGFSGAAPFSALIMKRFATASRGWAYPGRVGPNVGRHRARMQAVGSGADPRETAGEVRGEEYVREA